MMKHVLLICTALAAGAIGGSVTTYAVLMHERNIPQQLVRAQRFELINESGHTTSVWGVGESGYVQLAFGPETAIAAEPATPDRNTSRSKEKTFSAVVPRAAIGLQGEHGGPFLRFERAGGQMVVLMQLDSFDRPNLTMSDGQFMGLTLGSERSDTPDYRDKGEHWALSFRPEESARIGVRTEQHGTTSDVRGFIWTNAKPFQGTKPEK